MIKPVTLYNFCKECTDSTLVGNVLRALCKQQVTLTREEKLIVRMITNDSEWMDERVEENRKRERERKQKYRMSQVVPGTSRDTEMSQGQSGVPHHTSIRPSIRPSVHPSEHNNNRSVTVRARTREDAERNGNGNGTGEDVLIMPGGHAQSRKLAEAFAQAAKTDAVAFFQPEHDAVTICAAVTGDFRSLNRWRQLVTRKGEEAVRTETFAFYREISSGEDVSNRGAALNRRLAALPDAEPNN